VTSTQFLLLLLLLLLGRRYREVHDEGFHVVLSCKYRLGDQIEEDKGGRIVISTGMRKKIKTCTKITAMKYLGRFYTENEGKWETQ
jgi:hypothetical protein